MTVQQVLDVFTADPDREVLLQDNVLAPYLTRDRNDSLTTEEVNDIIAFCDRIGHLAAKDLEELARYEKEILDLQGDN